MVSNPHPLREQAHNLAIKNKMDNNHKQCVFTTHKCLLIISLSQHEGLTSAVNVLAVMSLRGAGTKSKNKSPILPVCVGKLLPTVFSTLSHHCLHSPCSQVSPTLSSRLSWRQSGGQGPGSQDLCWISSNWQSVSSLSGIRDLTGIQQLSIYIITSFSLKRREKIPKYL